MGIPWIANKIKDAGAPDEFAYYLVNGNTYTTIFDQAELKHMQLSYPTIDVDPETWAVTLLGLTKIPRG